MSDVAPAGWYDDPENPAMYRYWDGTVWTEHRSPKAPPPGPAGGGSAWQLVPNAFTLVGRHWRALLAIVLPLVGLSVLGVVFVYTGLDAALDPGLDDIIDRVTEPGFDPDNDPADDAFLDSIDFDPNSTVVLALILGGLAWLAGTVVAPIALAVFLIAARAGREPSVADTYRRTLRRILRIIGVYVLWLLTAAAVVVAAALVLALFVVISPFTLLLTIPAAIATVIWLWPVGFVATVALIATARGTPPARTAWSLVRGRWGPTAGRVLILMLVLIGVGIGTSFIATPVSLASVWAGLLVNVVLQLAQYAIGTAAALEIYDWAGGPVDPELTA